MPYYACMEGGMCETEGPLDICKEMIGPVPTPMPFENMAMWTMAIGEPLALFCGMPSCNLISMIEMSEGDDAGILLGLVSETIIEMVMADDGSPVLLIGGLPAVDFGISMTMQNLINSVGLYSDPSQAVVTGT